MALRTTFFGDLAPFRDGELELFLVDCVPGDDLPPAYLFEMWVDGIQEPVGDIDLRLSDSPDTLLYIGQVGFSVEPRFRGRGLAARSLRLLLPLARRHDFGVLWVTCNPENIASRRTCESAGGTYMETVPLPQGHPLWEQGERQKCRYRFDVHA